MRWIFLTLLLLNIFVFGMSWLERNDRYSGKSRDYITIENIKQIKSIRQDSSNDASLKGSMKEKQVCLMLGPMQAERDAEIVRRILVENAVLAKKVVQKIDRAPNYWVYLKPYRQREDAVEKIKKLQKSNIDSYLISQGSLKNGISLGVFENVDSARDMQEMRIQQGYRAELKNLPKSMHKYWVGVNSQYNIELVNKVLLLLKEVKIVTERRQILCESIASEVKLS